MLIHEDASTFHIWCGVVAEESLGIWSATDGTEHILGGDGLVFVLLLEMNSSEFTVFFQSLHHGVVVDLDAAFFHDHLEILADLAVHIWQDAVHPFDDGDLGAKIGECVGEFNADDAAADDGDGIWTLAQLEELIAGDNAWQLHAWNVQHDWLGASGEDDVVGGVVGHCAIGSGDLHGLVRMEHAAPVDEGDPVALEELFDAADELVDGLLLVVDDLFVIKMHVFCDDAELLSIFHFFVKGRRMDHGLGRNAAAIEAGTADFAFFNDGDGKSEFRCFDRCHVSAGTGPDDDQFKMIFQFSYLLHNVKRSVLIIQRSEPGCQFLLRRFCRC